MADQSSTTQSTTAQSQKVLSTVFREDEAEWGDSEWCVDNVIHTDLSSARFQEIFGITLPNLPDHFACNIICVVDQKAAKRRNQGTALEFIAPMSLQIELFDFVNLRDTNPEHIDYMFFVHPTHVPVSFRQLYDYMVEQVKSIKK